LPSNKKMATGLSQSQAAVFVVDDDAAVRDALAALFQSVGLQVKTFPSAQEFLQTKFPDCPFCLVLDVRLPGMSGLDFQSELLKAGVQVPIIFMTGHGDIPMTVRAMKAGAVEFLSKPFRDQDMLDAVQLAHVNDRRRRELDQSTSRLRADFDTLTPREKEIMKLVASGLINKQIAGKIGLSEITIKVHRGSLMRKLGAKSLADLVRMAETLGVTRTQA
jgi:FixJ family two-component response regulator